MTDISMPDAAEVRQRTVCTTEACGHSKAEHADPIKDDGHCMRCGCLGFDPMTTEEWAVVLNRQRLEGWDA